MVWVLVMSGSSRPGPRGKVSRLLDEYDLDGLGEFLVDRWTADDPDAQQSLRALAHQFNTQMLEARLAAMNAAPIEGTVERYYELLTDDNVSSGVRTQVRRDLEQAGIDVDDLQDEFVSRQAIHTYLTTTRDVSQPDKTSTISPSTVQQTIDRLRERVRQVTSSRLDRLRSAGGLTLGDFRVLVDVQVYCEDCGTQKSLAALLEDGACECAG